MLKEIFFGQAAYNDLLKAAFIAASPIFVDAISSTVLGRHIVSDFVSERFAQYHINGMSEQEIKEFQQSVEPDSTTADLLNHFTANLICTVTNGQADDVCQLVKGHSIFYGDTMREKLKLQR